VLKSAKKYGLVESGKGTITSISRTRIETKISGGGIVSFRTEASNLSPKTNATIDVKIPGLEELRKIKFDRP